MPTIKKQTNKKTRNRKPILGPSSAVDRITPLDELPDDGIKLCCYGTSGTGKTRFASTFAQLGPLLHLISSSNKVNESRSIRGTPNVDVVELQQPEDLTDLIRYAKQEDYKTVVLDHVTGFSDLVLAEIIGLERLPEQVAWGTATQQQYAQLGLQVKTYLRELLDLHCNVILIGQERVYNTREEGGDLIMPYISVAATPSVAGWIAPACDYVCQTFKREEKKTVHKKVGSKEKAVSKGTGKVEYCLRVGPNETYMTKFRVPPGTDLPDVVVDPSYDKISKLLEA